ncbi:MAG: phosphate transporter substrate-binding protein PstS [Marmoricola sp.]|nr:phosphate transporter substrate-binding protein PstS [Marmoricola sp.]
MAAWRAGFQTANGGVTVNYDPSGSGAGVLSFNSGAVDFAASDAALDPTKGEVAAAKSRCGANALEVPDYVSPIAVIFNLSGVSKLQLSAATIAGIFDGKIKKWNDPAIATENPGTTLPSSTITPVHRSDESGTTKNFTDYLSKAAGGAWTFPADKVWPLKSGEAANGTSGVVAAVKAGAGSIGYADESQTAGLTAASIKVGSVYTAPSAAGAAKALDVSPVDTTRTQGDLAIKVDRTTTEAGAYPLFLASYLIACPTYDKAKADLVKGFLSYIVSTAGQAEAAKTAGSAPLPASLQAKAASIIDTISAK